MFFFIATFQYNPADSVVVKLYDVYKRQVGLSGYMWHPPANSAVSRLQRYLCPCVPSLLLHATACLK